MTAHDEQYETRTYTIKKNNRVGIGTYDDGFRPACVDIVPKWETKGEGQGNVWVIKIYYEDPSTREEFEQCLDSL